MAITISAPTHSFVSFSESDAIQSCNFGDIELCLPVYEDNDVNFQFVLVADTEAEADALCDLANAKIRIGIVDDCADDFLIEFVQKTERFRIGATQVLYNWGHGLPGFSTVISRGECFRIKIEVLSYIYDSVLSLPYNLPFSLVGAGVGGFAVFNFCSNCFQRIGDPCHTSVIEYSNEDNFAGFNYCNSEETIVGGGLCPEECFDKTIIQFSNVPSLTVPYTAQLFAKYGAFPTVKFWLYDENSILVDMGIRATLDSYPPTVIKGDFGGNASGILVIS